MEEDDDNSIYGKTHSVEGISDKKGSDGDRGSRGESQKGSHKGSHQGSQISQKQISTVRVDGNDNKGKRN